MSIVTVIISAIIVVAIFWVLHIYAVRRARFLVRLQLGSFPEQKSEDAKMIHAVRAHQMVDTTNDSKNTQDSTKIESYRERRKIREKSPILSNEKRWAIPN